MVDEAPDTEYKWNMITKPSSSRPISFHLFKDYHERYEIQVRTVICPQPQQASGTNRNPDLFRTIDNCHIGGQTCHGNRKSEVKFGQGLK